MLFVCKMIIGFNVKTSEEVYNNENVIYYNDYAWA